MHCFLPSGSFLSYCEKKENEHRQERTKDRETQKISTKVVTLWFQIKFEIVSRAKDGMNRRKKCSTLGGTISYVTLLRWQAPTKNVDMLHNLSSQKRIKENVELYGWKQNKLVPKLIWIVQTASRNLFWRYKWIDTYFCSVLTKKINN